MRKIRLTQGKYALVDDEDFEWLNQWKWFADKVGNIWYASRGLYNKELHKHTKMLRMHRLIMKDPKGKLIDHLNGNGLNNQKKNLRVCGKSDNAKNCKVNRLNNTSGYKGVSLYKGGPLWHACIRLNYKSIHLGQFIKKDDAALAYNKAAKKIFGKFAKLNRII